MSRDQRSVHVLVMDDEAAVCRSVEKVLTRRGYSVTAVSSVAAALDVLEAGARVDLVLADLMMPGASGLDFLRMATDRWPRLPVVVVTGYASVASAVEATRLGAVDYLAKPFTPDELTATVAHALTRGPAGPPAGRTPRTAEPSAEGGDAIDVDLPFSASEVAQATSVAYVERLTRSDVPLLDFCALGQRRCKRVVARGVCQHEECPVVTAERRRASTSAVLLTDDPIDVDLPFSARAVAAVTGDAYVQALGRGDVPVTGRWTKGRGSAKRVLAVDDEVVVVHAVRRSLTGRGYRVDEAFTGQAALSRVATTVYDLVLLDMRMPDLDGLDVLPRIKAQQPGVPVVVVTGYASIETAVEAIRNGAADYLPKPFTPNELRRVADRVTRASA